MGGVSLKGRSFDLARFLIDTASARLMNQAAGSNEKHHAPQRAAGTISMGPGVPGNRDPSTQILDPCAETFVLLTTRGVATSLSAGVLQVRRYHQKVTVVQAKERRALRSPPRKAVHLFE